MIVFIKDIKWDTDGEFIPNLPSNLVVNLDIPEDTNPEDYISDWLSDTYGYCHFGYTPTFLEPVGSETLEDVARQIKKEYKLKETILSLIGK